MPQGQCAEQTEHKDIVKRAVLDDDTFLRLTLSQKLPKEAIPWVKISVRPVLIKGERKVQFSYFEASKDLTKNYSGAILEQKLDEALALPFRNIHVQTTSGDIHIKITRKGKALISRGKPSRREREPLLAHDRLKRRPLAVDLDTSDAFLQAIGVTNAKGGVRPSMRAKFRQINEFLRIIQQTVVDGRPERGPIHLVDCGCGSAHLTIAAHHYLNQVRGLPTHVVGIDTNEEIIHRCRGLAEPLGWEGLEFALSSIAGFSPQVAPEVVLSLHACDTATDEAIARGILWGSRVILAAPCCQHELHHQLRALPFRPLLRHGILRERLADLLTDTFRALVLRIMGYRTRVIEFVSPEHTSKNLMIRAQKGVPPGNVSHVREYSRLKEFWNVEPCLEEMLGQEFRRYLGGR